ncbi:MAG: hypothetical protein GEU75_03075 [Dehalococcoidia bacterium]|nr:hypothetical protein [Dehalococcoidia bacterium]
MSSWLSVVVLCSGVAVFCASLAYFIAFQRQQRLFREVASLQQRAIDAARLSPLGAQIEFADVLRKLKLDERVSSIESKVHVSQHLIAKMADDRLHDVLELTDMLDTNDEPQIKKMREDVARMRERIESLTRE